MNFIPPPPAPTLNTPAWARQQLQAFDPTSQRAITDLVAQGVMGKSLSSIRVPYARTCMDQRWEGWQARLAWTVVELLVHEATPKYLSDDYSDDIPF